MKTHTRHLFLSLGHAQGKGAHPKLILVQRRMQSGERKSPPPAARHARAALLLRLDALALLFSSPRLPHRRRPAGQTSSTRRGAGGALSLHSAASPLPATTAADPPLPAATAADPAPRLRWRRPQDSSRRPSPESSTPASSSLHADELRPPSPPLAGGVALRSARAALATPFLSSGAATPRCCSRRTGLRSSPSGGPDAGVETQKDGERTHICVARSLRPKMSPVFAYSVGACFFNVKHCARLKMGMGHVMAIPLESVSALAFAFLAGFLLNMRIAICI
jgi:hypothetical protein